jgi:hypothetical protein
MRGSRATVVLAVVVSRSAEGATLFAIELSDADDGRSPFANADALREIDPDAEVFPSLDPAPRDHIEAQSLRNLTEAVLRMRNRGRHVTVDVVAEQWRNWVSMRPESSQWGAAQRRRSARSIYEWVRELMR